MLSAVWFWGISRMLFAGVCPTRPTAGHPVLDTFSKQKACRQISARRRRRSCMAIGSRETRESGRLHFALPTARRSFAAGRFLRRFCRARRFRLHDCNSPKSQDVLSQVRELPRHPLPPIPHGAKRLLMLQTMRGFDIQRATPRASSSMARTVHTGCNQRCAWRWKTRPAGQRGVHYIDDNRAFLSAGSPIPSQ